MGRRFIPAVSFVVNASSISGFCFSLTSWHS